MLHNTTISLNLLLLLDLFHSRQFSTSIQLFLYQTPSWFKGPLILKGQSARDKRQIQSQASLLIQQIINKLVDKCKLVVANAIAEFEFAIVDIKRLKNLINLRGLDGESQVKHGHSSEVLIIPLREIKQSDFFAKIHLKHFEYEAQKFGWFFGAAVESSNALDFDGLVDDGLGVESEALFLPESRIEDAIAGGLVDHGHHVLVRHRSIIQLQLCIIVINDSPRSQFHSLFTFILRFSLLPGNNIYSPLSCIFEVFSHHNIQMGYQRERQRHRYRDNRPDETNRYRRRSPSRSDSERRERHHPNQRQYEYSRGRDNRDSRDQRHYPRHSRSRSREKRTDEEAKAQDRQQKIRVALRNNTINYDLGIHEMFMKLPEQKREELAEQAMAPQRIHECILVRELYVSGMYEAAEPMIRTFFSKYGEIEDVEIIKNFVFVKYYKVEDASNACADYHNINTTLHHNTHNANFKIFFADHLKRFNVVSNNPQYEIKDHLIPVLYASVRNDPQFTNQQYLHSIFSRFGFIRNMEVKRNELPTQRTYVLVEYETLAMALRAREKMRQQRDKLGDRKSEITILIDNQKITRLYPNINNQIRYQKKRQSTTTQPAQTTTQPAPSAPLPQHESFSYQQFPADSKQDFDIQGIMGILNEHAGNVDFEEQHLSADWCGFLTKNKTKKVEVDFFRIHKQPIELDEGILNVAYRAEPREALQSVSYILAGRFRASQQNQAEVFKQEYLGYFSRKGRAGVIMTPKYLIYLIPPLPELNINYPIRNDQLLALFFKMP